MKLVSGSRGAAEFISLKSISPREVSLASTGLTQAPIRKYSVQSGELDRK